MGPIGNKPIVDPSAALALNIPTPGSPIQQKFTCDGCDMRKKALRELVEAIESCPDDFEVGEHEAILAAAIARAKVVML